MGIERIRRKVVKIKQEFHKQVAQGVTEEEMRMQWIKTRRQRKRKGRAKGVQQSRQKRITEWVRGISYEEYLHSEWWKSVRRRKLKSTRGVCERCHRRASQVHHKHYKSLGAETNGDLEAICRECHSKEHEGIIQAKKHLDVISRQE